MGLVDMLALYLKFVVIGMLEKYYRCKRGQENNTTATTILYLRRPGLALRPRPPLPFLGPVGGGRTNA